jgi:hypothetical protein
MKRVATLTTAWKALAIAFLLTFSTVVFAQREVPAVAPSEDEFLNIQEVQSAANELFRLSRCNPQSVRAMWVTFENGEYGVVPWPPSYEYYKETWNGPLPEHAVAIMHTVQMERSEQPTFEDQELADGKQGSEVRLPVYVLHHFAITKVVPGGSKAVQVRGAGWAGAWTGFQG